MIRSKKLFGFIALIDDVGNSTVVRIEESGKLYPACLCGEGQCTTPYEVSQFIENLGAEEARQLGLDSEIAKFLKTATLSDIENTAEDEAFFDKKRQEIVTEKRVRWLAHLEKQLSGVDNYEASERERLGDKRKYLEDELAALGPKYEEKRNKLREEIATLQNKLVESNVTTS